MARTFIRNVKRRVYPLSGAWRYKKDENGIGKENGWYNGLTDAATCDIPSVWNTEFGMLTYCGKVWYEREFYFDGGTARLCFGAVMTECEIWLDGVFVGSHYGGFCEFSVTVRSVSPGMHRLTVLCDNSFDESSIPQIKVDWYHYGGIIRDVDAELLCGICVNNIRVEYELSADLKKLSLCAIADLYNAGDAAATDSVCFKLDGLCEFKTDVTLDAAEECTLELGRAVIEDFELWDPAAPKLYGICAYTSCDDLYDRVGFRKIEVCPEGVLINGNLTELRGVNRHEEHPDHGFAFPRDLMRRDIDIIRDLGCNTVRGSHYPASRYFMDLADEYGILYWSEIPIWGYGFSPKALADKTVIERGAEMHRDMVKYYYNHPSIIIWGMHNEIHSECEEAVPMTKLYYEFLKANGGNRIVTYASDKILNDICFEWCDLISINTYVGWYYGEIEEWQAQLDKIRRRRDELGCSHKPVIMSEFGAAALYGHHTFDNVPWTEEYQANLISHALEVFHASDMCCGFYVWQFADIRTCLEVGLNRARGFNNKGILNEHRKPKLAYLKTKELYEKFKAEN